MTASFQNISLEDDDDLPFKTVPGSSPAPASATPFKPIASPKGPNHLGIAKVVESDPYKEPNKLFATGLPEWNLDPPGDFVVRNNSAPKKGGD